MAETSPRRASDPSSQSLSSTSSASHLLSVLTCCEYTTECHHDMNPWSDSDPELRPFSTAALEALQEHLIQEMKSLLHKHDVLNKELADRKLESRFATSAAAQGEGKTSEVIFSTDDFEPRAMLVGPREDCLEVVGCGSGGDVRDAMAKMCLAWISDMRETTRSSRSGRAGSVKSRAPDEVPVVVDVEGAPLLECGSVMSQDLDDLEAEMEVVS